VDRPCSPADLDENPKKGGIVKAKRVVLLCLLAAVLIGCATVGVKPWAERSPMEKSSYFMSIYNRQYADAMAMASNSNLTEAQKVVVRKKKDVLEKAWPAIRAYDDIAVRGEIPSALSEQAILDYINQLATLGG
jgi:hypothetical protein